MRKLKLLAISTLTTIALIMALTLAACGGDPAPVTNESQSERPTNQETASTDQSGDQSEDQTSTPILDPLPTKPIRLTNLGTPTAQPVRPTRSRPSTSEAPGATTASSGTNTQTPDPAATTTTNAVLSPLDLIPDNPKANDTVLLQDIYDRMDLDQFALDPSKPIEKFQPRDALKFPRTTVENHPYLHMFPDLELLTENTRTEKPNLSSWPDVIYSPTVTPGTVDITASNSFFKPVDPLTYFIYHPWFEQLHMGRSNSGSTGLLDKRVRNYQNPDHEFFGSEAFTSSYYRYGPYWFGKNSTRGVLSNAIAGMMKEAAYPTTQLMPLTWQTGTWYYEAGNPGKAVIEYNWKLDEYIRTTVSRDSQDAREINLHLAKNKYNIPGGFQRYYIAPEIKWEFAHQKLPIIRVTAQNSKILPLTLPGLEHPEPTEYSVSFVISFQNRWQSLDDPNRWVKRFKETPWGDGTGYNDFLAGRTERKYTGEKYEETPGEWHYTDYMQHRIIGPVVLQVHTSPVLEPGTYSVTPNVTNWEAPGYIATDKQILKLRRVPNEQGRIAPDSKIVPHFDDLPDSRAPNANYPLPGHVMTDAFTAPGTNIWERYEMNENEW